MKITWRAELLPLIIASMAVLIVITGGYVRIHDSGESCPDWPTCFGKIHPFSSEEEQTKWWDENSDEIDSRGENKRYSIFEIFIEWLHRLIVGITGFVVIANLYFVHKSRKSLGIDTQFSSYLVAILLFLQALVGAITVKYDNVDWSVSLHLFLAMVFITSLLLHWLLWARASKILSEKFIPSLNYAKSNIRIYGIMSFSVLILLMIGAWLSSAAGGTYNVGCNIGFYEGWPLCHSKVIPNLSITPIFVQMIHRFAVIIVAGILIYGYLTMNKTKSEHPSDKIIDKFVNSGIILFFVNSLIGGLYIITAKPDGFIEMLSLLHLLVGAASFLCIVYALLICILELRYSKQSLSGSTISSDE